MGRKKKNTNDYSLVKSITNISIWRSYLKYLWIFAVPVLVFFQQSASYKLKKERVRVVQLTDSLNELSTQVEDLTAKNQVLNNNLMATSAQLNDLQNRVTTLTQNLQKTTLQYSDYKANINDDLNSLKSDLYRMSSQLNSLQQKILGNQRQGQDR